ncbi:MAG: type III pantothenate kinase [Flavobacteriaceae bacterium]|nr:type III pantothenate kinase [Flavobacteriaceae bacterium]
MNLIIDVGNTYIKLAVFANSELLQKWRCQEEAFFTCLDEVSEAYTNIKNCMISSVGKFSEEEISALKKKFHLIILSKELQLPFVNLYSTPKTLGVDRIALVSAAAHQFPDKNVLVIDAGSCITYDFLNDQNEYLGGAISPGMEMRYKAMHTFTANLPLLNAEAPENLIGNSTSSSMHVGVIQGVINELEGFIERYNENFTNLTVILTGGDAHFLRDSIKNDIFANSNFLLEGLNHLLETNNDSC